MTLKKIALFAATSACLSLLTVSCSEWSLRTGPGPIVKPGPGNGPPAHAKAYGYRRKHVSGVELVFDSGKGVYVVVGLPDHYYHDGYFYRLSSGAWEMSLKPDAGWVAVSMASLPPGLQARGDDGNNGKGHGNGKNKRAS